MNEIGRTILILARQVRERTLGILGHAPAETLLFTVAGTSNHIVWHAGHALWVQDALCVELLTGESRLPAGWAGRFGQDSQPGTDGREWPGREELIGLLTEQMRVVEGVLMGPWPEGEELAEQVIHGWHDEAIHQGEMKMLMKMFRARGR